MYLIFLEFWRVGVVLGGFPIQTVARKVRFRGPGPTLGCDIPSFLIETLSITGQTFFSVS